MEDLPTVIPGDSSELHSNDGSPAENTGELHDHDGSAETTGELHVHDGSGEDTGELHDHDGSAETTGELHIDDGSAETTGELHVDDGSAETTGELHVDDGSAETTGELHVDDGSAETTGELHVDDGSPAEDTGELHIDDGSAETTGELHVDEEPQAEPDSTETEIKLDTSSMDDSSTQVSLNLENIPMIIQPNPAFLKPFEVGWKREMVFRNPTCDSNRRRVDVYYYTPSGKKLRSLKNIAEHLEGTDLTVENFTFIRSSLGTDDPEKEIVRNAKRSSSGNSFRISKRSRREPSDATGTPKVVLKNSLEVGENNSTVVENDLNEETCSWLPPMWGKLLRILNRQS